MKISGLQENIKQGLFAVNHITQKNINLPILNNILIEAREGKIKFISTNLELGIINSIRGKIEKEGSFTVDAKVISDYISLLPNQKIDLELKDNELLINCENYKTKIKGQSAEEYPLIPVVEREKYFSCETSLLKKALSQIIFAAANNDTRLELTGVLLVIKGKKLIFAATDSYRLAEKKIEINTNNEEVDKRIIVPAKTIQELIRILMGLNNEEITGETCKETRFYISENQILFTCGSIEIVSRLIEGQYPEYEQIIPQNCKTKALVERLDITRAVKASSLFAKTGINDINLDLPANKNKIIISSTSNQVGENITEINGEVNGEDNGIVINYRYLLDGLNNLNSEAVKIEIVDGNTPCMLKPDKGDDYLYVIMPIKQ